MVSYAELDFLDLDNNHGHQTLLERETEDVDCASISNVITEHAFFKEAQKMKERYVDTMSKYTQAMDDLRICQTNQTIFHNDVIKFFERLDIKDENLKSNVDNFVSEFSEYLSDKISESQFEVDKFEKDVAICRGLSRVYRDMSEQNNFTCFMCLSKTVDTIFKPCHHTVCQDCAYHKRCPFCRGDILSIGRIYFG